MFKVHFGGGFELHPQHFWPLTYGVQPCSFGNYGFALPVSMQKVNFEVPCSDHR